MTLTTTAALPSLTLTSATTPEPSSCLIASAVPRSSLAGTPSSVRAAKRISPTCLKPLPRGAPAHGELAAQVGRLALQPPALLDQRLEPRRQLGRRHLQALRQALQQVVLAARLLVGELAGHRLDPADAGRDRALADDAEQGDVAGAADMGAAAQLDRVGPAVLAQAHRDHAHLVAVLLAEQRHGTGADRVVAGHDPHRAPRRCGAGSG